MNSTCDVTDGVRSPWNLPVDVVSKSSQEVITVARKLRTLCSMLLGGSSILVPSRTLARSVVAGVLNEVRLSGVHTTNCLVTDRDSYIERKLLSIGNA